MNRYDDAHFEQWPYPTTGEERAAEGYLKSLNAAGEMAVFLSVRAMCWREAGQMGAAAEAFQAAARLAPEVQSYRVMAAECHDQAESVGKQTNQVKR